MAIWYFIAFWHNFPHFGMFSNKNLATLTTVRSDRPNGLAGWEGHHSWLGRASELADSCSASIDRVPWGRFSAIFDVMIKILHILALFESKMSIFFNFFVRKYF
jgi:hypothetical protein